jgi:hypothetical protein
MVAYYIAAVTGRKKRHPSLTRGRSTLVVCMSYFAKIPAWIETNPEKAERRKTVNSS